MEDEEEKNLWKDDKWLAKGKMIVRDEEEAKAEKKKRRMPLNKHNRSGGVEPEDATLQERLSKLMVPNKYIKFCKDACDEKILVRTAMGYNYTRFDLVCPCCAEKEETMIHCLRECAHAIEVWSTSQLWSRVARISSSTFKEFLRAVTRVLKDDNDLSLFVLICWFLWEARNDYVLHHIVPNPADILRNALLLLEKASRWAKDKLLRPLIADMARCGHGQWKRPPNGWLKMNVEAYLSGRMMAMGAVVRDDNGRFFAAVSVSRKYSLGDLLLAQTLALMRALIWAENSVMIHHQKVIVELTPLRIVDFFYLPGAATSLGLPNRLRNPLEQCRLIASHFRTLHFANANDQENRLAYGLAGLAVRQECEGSWVAPDVPEWLQEAVTADVPH